MHSLFESKRYKFKATQIQSKLKEEPRQQPNSCPPTDLFYNAMKKDEEDD